MVECYGDAPPSGRAETTRHEEGLKLPRSACPYLCPVWVFQPTVLTVFQTIEHSIGTVAIRKRRQCSSNKEKSFFTHIWDLGSRKSPSSRRLRPRAAEVLLLISHNESSPRVRILPLFDEFWILEKVSEFRVVKSCAVAGSKLRTKLLAEDPQPNYIPHSQRLCQLFLDSASVNSFRTEDDTHWR